jgi:hypothetical protein
MATRGHGSLTPPSHLIIGFFLTHLLLLCSSHFWCIGQTGSRAAEVSNGLHGQLLRTEPSAGFLDWVIDRERTARRVGGKGRLLGSGRDAHLQGVTLAQASVPPRRFGASIEISALSLLAQAISRASARVAAAPHPLSSHLPVSLLCRATRRLAASLVGLAHCWSQEMSGFALSSPFTANLCLRGWGAALGALEQLSGRSLWQRLTLRASLLL